MNSFTTRILNLPISETSLGFYGNLRGIANSVCYFPWDSKRTAAVNSSLNLRVKMRDRSKNRKPLQKGRNLSIEAIQTVQTLKRANASTAMLEQAFQTRFRRLLKLDMIAVLRELLRQNECYLALKVFEDIRKEYWYKPQVSLYAEMVSVLGSNGLLQEVEILFIKLKEENCLEPDIDGFNVLLESLTNFNLTGLAMDCFYLMQSLGCDPDRLSLKILISSLESKGEVSLLPILYQEAKKYYSLEFLDEKDESTTSSD